MTGPTCDPMFSLHPEAPSVRASDTGEGSAAGRLPPSSPVAPIDRVRRVGESYVSWRDRLRREAARLDEADAMDRAWDEASSSRDVVLG